MNVVTKRFLDHWQGGLSSSIMRRGRLGGVCDIGRRVGQLFSRLLNTLDLISVAMFGRHFRTLLGWQGKWSIVGTHAVP